MMVEQDEPEWPNGKPDGFTRLVDWLFGTPPDPFDLEGNS